ncbi:MAG: hypothetical protein WC750_01815 [Patescibacteria group bacterium]|jgi:hypothetical protein
MKTLGAFEGVESKAAVEPKKKKENPTTKFLDKLETVRGFFELSEMLQSWPRVEFSDVQLDYVAKRVLEISNDNDFESYNSERLQVLKELPEALIDRPKIHEMALDTFWSILYDFSLEDLPFIKSRFCLTKEDFASRKTLIEDAYRFFVVDEMAAIPNLAELTEFVVDPVPTLEDEGSQAGLFGKMVAVFRSYELRNDVAVTENVKGQIHYGEQLLELLRTMPQARSIPGLVSALNVAVQNSEIAVKYLNLLEADTGFPEDAKVLAQAVLKQEEGKKDEEVLTGDGYSFRLFQGAREIIPAKFLEEPYAYALQHGKVIKNTNQGKEIIWKFPGENGAFIVKKIQANKMPRPDHELRILQRARLLGLQAPLPLGLFEFPNGDVYSLMEFVAGESGIDLARKLFDPDERNEHTTRQVGNEMTKLAKEFREKMWIDKPWQIKDCLFDFGPDGQITRVFPLDWERSHPYDPFKPETIEGENNWS